MTDIDAFTQTDTAHDEIRLRIATLRKQAERAREEAAHAEGLATYHHTDALAKERMADQYADILSRHDD